MKTYEVFPRARPEHLRYTPRNLDTGAIPSLGKVDSSGFVGISLMSLAAVSNFLGL